jgi:hypothetical protein
MNTYVVSAEAGSTVTGRSIGELEQGGMTSATEQLRVLRVHPRVDNELSAWCDFEVVFNEHIYSDEEYLTT